MWLLALVAVAALWAMQRTTPNYTRLMAPIEHRGDSGATVEGRTMAVRVDRVELARSLRVHRVAGTRTLDTGGVWLIVHATASSVEEPETLKAAAVETTGGLRYQQTDRVGPASLLSSKTLQPGVPVSGDLVFELPPSALPGAELLVSHHVFGAGFRDSMLRIRLPLDAARRSTRTGTLSAQRPSTRLRSPTSTAPWMSAQPTRWRSRTRRTSCGQ
jgi:hypothetical protein